MARIFSRAIDGRSRLRDLFRVAHSPRRSRNRMIPDALLLEGRICLSGFAPASRTDHLAALVRATHSEHRQTVPIEEIRHPHSTTAIHKAPKISHHSKPPKPVRAPRAPRPPKQPKAPNPPKTPSTVYVTPGATSGPNSLATVVKSATPGETIVLAAGTYTQNIVISNQSNITIVGAANQSSILAPASGDAIKVVSSSNITIENVWFRSQGSQGRGLAVVGSSVTLQGIKTDGTLGDGVVAAAYLGRSANINATSTRSRQETASTCKRAPRRQSMGAHLMASALRPGSARLATAWS
jgi:hypothetical protein